MFKRILIVSGVAAALAGAVWLSQSPASAQGWGMMGGYGPGYHMGWGGGPGWNCPGFGPGGPGAGYHMRGWGGRNGPGLMQGYGYGPGMMQGYGFGRGSAQGNLNLTVDDVKSRMERWLARQDNPRLKLGEVKEQGADSITADIVTKDNALVDRFIVDRHTGFTRRDNG
jgi:hypothetical protein